eukprot:scaffold125131_cov57-Phaeocystis_antarctica.AAC.1
MTKLPRLGFKAVRTQTQLIVFRALSSILMRSGLVQLTLKFAVYRLRGLGRSVGTRVSCQRLRRGVAPWPHGFPVCNDPPQIGERVSGPADGAAPRRGVP